MSTPSPSRVKSFHEVLVYRSFPSTPFHRLSTHSQSQKKWLPSPLLSMDVSQILYLIAGVLFHLYPPHSAVRSILSDDKLVLQSLQLRVSFHESCLVDLVPEPGYDLKLGRDWFNYCTTSVPGAQILLSDDMCLVFSSYLFFCCACS
jgi:hypothetical protein